MRPKGGWKNVGDVEIAVAEYATGSTTDVYTARSGSFRPPSSRPPTGHHSPTTTAVRTRSSPRSDPSSRASTKPGAIHGQSQGRDQTAVDTRFGSLKTGRIT